MRTEPSRSAPAEGQGLIRESFLVQPFDGELAEEGARLARDLFGRGRFPGWMDVAIAATAKHFDEELVTRDRRHFAPFRGLSLRTY